LKCSLLECYNYSMKLDQEQIRTISKYFSDLSKIVFASAVLGFIIPTESLKITLTIFVLGSIATISFIFFSVIIIKQNKI